MMWSTIWWQGFEKVLTVLQNKNVLLSSVLQI